MTRLRLTNLILVLALFLPISTMAAQDSPRTLQPLGTGAQFVSADSPFYLALDLDPSSEGMRRFRQLTSLYLGSPEMDQARSQMADAAGIDESLDDIVQALGSWVGGGFFLALPTADDLRCWQSSRSCGDEGCQAPDVLMGAAIGSESALRSFMARRQQQAEDDGLVIASEDVDGTTITQIGRNDPEAQNAYLAMARGYLLIGTKRQGLLEAVSQERATSLAATEAFRTAAARFSGRPFAAVFSAVPNDVLSFGGAGIVQQSQVNWVAGALTLSAQGARVDLSSSVDAGALGPAAQTLLGKPTNRLQSASVVPGQSVLFTGWDNLKLLWDQVVETAWPDQAAYAQVHDSVLQATGLDLDADIFGWMTGEVAIFAAPDSSAGVGGSGLAIGLIAQAKDPALVRSKLDKIADAAASLTGAAPGPKVQVEVGGASLRKTDLGGLAELHTGVVGNWAVVTTGASLAKATVDAVQGKAPTVATNAEFKLVRSGLPAQQQFMGFIDLPQIVRITSSSVGAAVGDVSQARDYLRPIRGVGLSMDTAPSHIDGTFFVHIDFPAAPPGG